MRHILALLSLSSLMQSSIARAEELPAPDDAATRASNAYCTYVEAVGDSQAALLVSPQLFVSGGMVAGSDSPTGAQATGVDPRVIAGAAYSVGSLYRGIQTKKSATADCTRQRAFNQLVAYTFSQKQGQSVGALKAKLEVLENARTHAEEILTRVREGVADAKFTVDELNVSSAHVDAIRSAIAATSGELRTAAGSMKQTEKSLDTLVAESAAAERAYEEQASRVRESYAWDISVRGGYDHIFGQHQPLPVFGLVTATFTPGYFWQRGADDRAEAARAAAARTSLEGGATRAMDLAREMRELMKAERVRLADVMTLVAELDTRQKALEGMAGDRARAAADLMWLALVPLRAEQAFLSAHVADLDRSVGKAPAR